MFDKLVESDMTGADLKPRRRIFVASFAFVAILFATAVVAGIYAADYTLGTDNFDIAELLSPVAATEPETEPEPEPVRQQRSNQSYNNETIRQVVMAPTDDPTRVPEKTSAEVNPYRSVSPDKYANVKIGAANIDPAGQGGPDRTGEPGGSSANDTAFVERDKFAETRPPAAPKVERKTTVKSGGVVNGTAIELPKPTYSAAAIAMQVKGAVNVQVMIDETGKVVSAKAVSGHILLRPAAESAAWKARFRPTTLTGTPVKVSGIIVYNFTR